MRFMSVKKLLELSLEDQLKYFHNVVSKEADKIDKYREDFIRQALQNKDWSEKFFKKFPCFSSKWIPTKEELKKYGFKNSKRKRR